MARVQVYLPDDLHAAMKQRGLSASSLLQSAIEGEVRRAELLAKVDLYLDALDETYGPAAEQERAVAEAWADNVAAAVRANAAAADDGGNQVGSGRAAS